VTPQVCGSLFINLIPKFFKIRLVTSWLLLPLIYEAIGKSSCYGREIMNFKIYDGFVFTEGS
jgi:hypothetical protein